MYKVYYVTYEDHDGECFAQVNHKIFSRMQDVQIPYRLIYYIVNKYDVVVTDNRDYWNAYGIYDD